MDNFWEKLKDILYDGTDYIIMIITIVIVVVIINWRVGGLFKRTKLQEPSQKPGPSIGMEDNSYEDNFTNGDEDGQDEGANEDNNEADEIEGDARILTVNIPAGSLPGQIGDILAGQGLVESKEEFVNKTVEMAMDTRLKSGTFEIPSNSSLEEIINIISK